MVLLSGNKTLRFAGIVFLAAFLLLGVAGLDAAPISPISDLIFDSGPGLLADHTVSFRTTSVIPVAGTIVITPEATQFSIPAAMDFEDIDLSVGGVDRDLAAVAGVGAGSDIGVSIVSGASGSITFTLNDTDNILSGADVLIEIGAHAAHQVVGVEQITNPAVAGRSYTVDVEYHDAMATLIDAGQTRIMILEKVAVDAMVVIPGPPDRLNGLPDIDLPDGTTTVVMSLATDIFALCRYDTIPGTIYSLMPFAFSATITTEHETTLVGLTNDTDYIFYVRCENFFGTENLDDFVIFFSILPPGPGSTGGGGGSGTGSASNSGSGGPGTSGSTGDKFPAPPGSPSVSMTGWAPREATVRILKEGQVLSEGTASITGDFSLAILDMESAIHTISVSATDADGLSTRALSFTFNVEPGTSVVISGVQLPPTITLSTDRVDPGGSIVVSGMAPPSKPVEVWISLAGEKDAVIRQEITAAADGRYSVTISINLPSDAYDVRSRAFHPQVGWGEYSQRMPLGVGQEAPLNTCERSDMNKDTRVNLIDFSILLFHWTTNFPDADINLDGTVSLIDFSIQLFCWTG